MRRAPCALGGIVILLFIIFHLAQLTWKVPGVDGSYVFLNQDPYSNLITAFQSPIVTISIWWHWLLWAFICFTVLGACSRHWDSTAKPTIGQFDGWLC